MSRCRPCAPVPEEVRRAAGLLERRWTVSILWASYEGASRFNEFRQAVGEIPPGTLAQRLVELEGAGLLEREVLDAPPTPRLYRRHRAGPASEARRDALVVFARPLALQTLGVRNRVSLTARPPRPHHTRL